MSVKAATLLVAQALANLALWVPLPLVVLWVASQIDYHSGSLALGVAAGFAVLLVGVRVGVVLVHRIDAAWLAASTIAWRDNAVFVWWDPSREVYGQVHVSTTPNGEGSRARCAFHAAGRSFEFQEPLEAGTFNSDSMTVDLSGRIRADHDRRGARAA